MRRDLVPGSERVRRVNIRDVFVLYSWVNDPVNRANSISQSPVGRLEHFRWFFRTYRSGNERIFMVEQIPRSARKGVPLMFCRFSRASGPVWEISVNLNPMYRGLGLSKGLLARALDYLAHTQGRSAQVLATVRLNNEPSRRMFIGLGFEEVARDEDFLRLKRWR